MAKKDVKVRLSDYRKRLKDAYDKQNSLELREAYLTKRVSKIYGNFCEFGLQFNGTKYLNDLFTCLCSDGQGGGHRPAAGLQVAEGDPAAPPGAGGASLDRGATGSGAKGHQTAESCHARAAEAAQVAGQADQQ